MRAAIRNGVVTGGFVGRAYSTANPGMQEVAQRTETPKVTSMGLEVQKEYTILQSEPVGDLVQMELIIDGRASSPGLGDRQDALAEIMIEIAEDNQ